MVLASGGRVAWLARAYAIAIAVMLLLTIAALVRLRRTRRGPTPFKARGNLRLGEPRASGGASRRRRASSPRARLAMILTGDVASIAAAALIAALVALVHLRPATRGTGRQSSADESTFDLLLAAELSPDQIEARPGNVLVPVRNPHLLAHVAAALQTPGDRDVVVMTARLLDVDVSEETPARPRRRRTSGGCSRTWSRWPSASAVRCAC